MMQTILKGFVQKSGETRFSITVIAKHKSKIETIGAIQHCEMTKLTKWAKWRNLNMEIIYLCDNNLIIININLWIIKCANLLGICIVFYTSCRCIQITII
jgi:hypothetical protein